MLANTTQVYPEDRGTNYAVRLGEQAAAELLRALADRDGLPHVGVDRAVDLVRPGLLELLAVGAGALVRGVEPLRARADRDVVRRRVAEVPDVTFVPFETESEAGENAKSSIVTDFVAARGAA